MNAWTLRGSSLREEQIVLVLQGDTAFWFRRQRPGAVETFTESIETSVLSRETACPWIKVAPGSPVPGITLLLDSSLDEVDRVKAEGLPAGWLRRLQMGRMTRHLREEYPSASIHRLPPCTAPDVTSIVHHVVPESWQQWLLHLQEAHVSITHVVTGLELLCRYAASGPGSGAGSAAGSRIGTGSGDVLFDVPTGGDARHLLVIDGVPVFMRIVSGNEGVGAGNCIDHDLVAQTLTHVRRQIPGLARPPQVLQPGVSADGADRSALVPRLLADLYFGEQACLRAMVLGEKRSLETGASIEGDDITKSVGSTGATARRRWRPWTRESGPSTGQWRLSPQHRLAAGVLQMSVVRNRVQRRIRQLQKATLLCAWMAAVMVVVASVHGVATARERSRLGIERQRVSEQVQELSVSVRSLSRNPAFVVRSMERIDAHAQMAAIESGNLLAIVAAAISEYPSLILDELSWSLLQSESAHDVAFTAVGQMPDQVRIWQEDSPVARLQVELGGTVSGETGLREQQQVLERFARHLDAIPAVSAVSVLESPITSARSSDRLVRGQPVYRLSLLLGVS